MHLPLVISGHTIALVAPSYSLEKEQAVKLEKLYLSRGFKVKNTYMPDEHAFPFSMEDGERLATLQHLLDDPSISVIHCLRGGYGLSRIIDQIDFSAFIKSPKWVVGFSDVTLLLLAIQSFGISCIHGPMASHVLSDMRLFESLLQFLSLGTLKIKGTAKEGVRSTGNGKRHRRQPYHAHKLSCDKVSGKRAKKWLLLEEVGEAAYQIDRMMAQLFRAGILSQAEGILMGHFTEVKSSTFPASPLAIMQFWARKAGLPVIYGIETGHSLPNLPIPFNVKAAKQLNSGVTTLNFSMLPETLL